MQGGSALNDPFVQKALFAFGGALFALVIFFLKDHFSSNKDAHKGTSAKVEAEKEKRTELEKDMIRLRGEAAKAWENLRVDLAKQLAEMDKRWSDAFNQMAIKTELLAGELRSYTKDVTKLEGAVTQHMGLLSSQIADNRALGDMVKRLFDYVDAKERATDKAVREAKG